MKQALYVITSLLLLLAALTSCTTYSKVQKTTDYNFKYEMAKQYYAQGYYNRSAQLITEVLPVMKGTSNGEESLYLAAKAHMKARNYSAAAPIFRKYYTSYPKGKFTEMAQFNCGIALTQLTPQPKLDQTPTYEAVTELQNFIENYPDSPLRYIAQDKIFEMQDILVEKEYLSAKLYYNLGDYIGNGGNGNYKACIVTAENAIKDYPYTKRREEFALLILKAKFALADFSVEEKKEERFHEAIDEYYGFVTEYPESKYLKEAQALYKQAGKYVKKASGNGTTDTENPAQ